MFTDPAGITSARKQVAFQSNYGCTQEVLTAEQCIAIEPALANTTRQRWVGGVYTPSEEVGDCAQFCHGLVQHMLTQPKFRFLHSTRITGLRIDNLTLRAVQTTSAAGGDNITADAFVMALGANSAALARQAGFTLPVYPLKGYSITVPLDTDTAQTAAPQISITDISQKIVYARLANHLRVAGRVELVGMDQRISHKAIAELQHNTRTLFPGTLDDNATDNNRLSPWSGFRPATPSGIPIIGASPIKHLYLNVGQGSLGWTLACGSAALLTAHISGDKTAIDDTPFRFSA